MKIPKQELIEKYQQGETIKSLASFYNSSSWYIRHRLNNLGISTAKKKVWIEYAKHSLENETHVTAELFKVSKDAIYTARTRYKKLINS